MVAKTIIPIICAAALYFCMYSNNRSIVILLSGLYSEEELLSKGILRSSDPAKEQSQLFAVTKIINNGDTFMFLPCQKTNDLPIYYPFKIETCENSSDSMKRITIVNCYECNKFIKLNPSDSISLYSNVSVIGECENTTITNIVFYFPYVCDTANRTVDFFKVRAGIDRCTLITAPTFYSGCKQ